MEAQKTQKQAHLYTKYILNKYSIYWLYKQSRQCGIVTIF